MARYSPYCFILVLGVICPSCMGTKQLCSNLLFKNVEEFEMPLVQMEGLYTRTSMTHDDFPVFKSEESGLYFYYSYDPTKNVKMFTFGQEVGGPILGVVAAISTNFDPKHWPSTGKVNSNDVFGDVIEGWFYYFPIEKTFKKVYSVDRLKAVCVEEDSLQCDSGKLYVNDTITSGNRVLNNPKIDFFEKLPEVYSTIRPIYKHNRQNWYLYYKDNYWRIANSYTGSSKVFFRVEDRALKPEYVTGIWKVWSGTSWTAVVGLKILCRGIANGKSICQGSSSLCKNSGTCLYTKGNESVCVCKKGTYGLYCEDTRLCASPKAPQSSISVIWVGRRPGEIATSFCVRGYQYQPVEFYVCEAGKNWLLESKASCQLQPPTNPPTQPPFTFPPVFPPGQIPTTNAPWNPSLDFLIFFGPCLAFHIVVPALIWLGIFIARIIKIVRSTESGSSERIKNTAKISEQRYWLLLRVYSAFFNFMFWPWLVFVFACASSEFRYAHSNLMYCAMGMCGFCALFVTIEGYLCAQRTALSNITTWDYVLSMHASSPMIEIIISRYEWKFYEVYHTDSTGYRHYEGTESRKVNKKTVREPFVYTTWEDESEKEVLLQRRWTRVDFEMDFKLGDVVTENAFKAQEEILVEKSKHLNSNYTLSRRDHLANFKPHVLLCSDVTSVPWWMSEKYFWVATLCQLSWIYRAYFDHQTGFLEYVLRKKVFCQPVSSRNLASFPQESEGDVSRAGPSNICTSENRPLIEFSNQGNGKNYMSV